MVHPIFVINLKKRTDRKEHIIKEFSYKQEFSLNIVEAIENPKGGLGLWSTIQCILKNINEEYIIICEDDLQFTKHYSERYLNESIIKAKKYNSDILLGGMSWVSTFIQISPKLLWIEKFAGIHFMVVFQKFMKIILNASMDDFDATDFRIASLTQNAMCMFPFIAIQKEFDYSDATPHNNQKGRVNAFFHSTIEKIKTINKVTDAYKKMHKKSGIKPKSDQYKNMTVSTYVINLPERKDRLLHIKKEFIEKPEFDLIIVRACKHKIAAYSLLLGIRKIIKMAVKNNDDVIIICEDNHQFTSHYSKEYLFKNIVEAYQEGASCLSGGISRFDFAIPLTKNRFWVSSCSSTQFMVLYKDFFNRILDEPFDEKTTVDLLYSEITSNKMVLYPFVSIQKNFGDSGTTDINSKNENLVSSLFTKTQERFEIIQRTFFEYKL